MEDMKLVITGISSISACGIGFDSLATGLSQKPEMSSVKDFEFHQFDRDIPCFRIRDFEPKEILGKKGLRTKDLATKILLATMELEFKERFDNEELDTRPGIVVGTAFGSVQSIGDFLSDSIVNGVNSVNPMLFANTVINSPTGNANIRYGVKTLSTTVSTAFNSGIDALIYTCDYLRSGYLTSMVAGGLEEISYYTLMGLDRSGALSKLGTMKPFAQDADGIVTGEGCAMFLIETDESALAHGVNGIAEIAGYGNAFDPAEGKIGFNQEGEGAKYAIEQALSLAQIDTSAIDFVVSGGNGIPDGDAMESRVIGDMFGDIPVTAYKTHTGECYGASGALLAACTVSDMKNNCISGCGNAYSLVHDINLVSETIKNKESEYALVTTFSCDGNCSALIIKNMK